MKETYTHMHSHVHTCAHIHTVISNVIKTSQTRLFPTFTLGFLLTPPWGASSSWICIWLSPSPLHTPSNWPIHAYKVNLHSYYYWAAPHIYQVFDSCTAPIISPQQIEKAAMGARSRPQILLHGAQQWQLPGDGPKEVSPGTQEHCSLGFEMFSLCSIICPAACRNGPASSQVLGMWVLCTRA